jgi:hypothetical protein
MKSAITGPYQVIIRCFGSCFTEANMQPKLVLSLGPALMPNFTTGALFHSILAWPTAEETATFQQVSEELMASAIRRTVLHDPSSVQAVLDEWPQIAWERILARAKKPRPALGYLQKRLNQRMAAARAGIGIMYEQLFAQPALLPPGMTALSIDQLCALIRSDVSIDDPENIEKLVWRKSLPIIPLAVATQLMLTGKFGPRAEVGCDLQDVEFYREAVRLAQRIETVVDEHPNVAVTIDRLTVVRWFE